MSKTKKGAAGLLATTAAAAAAAAAAFCGYHLAKAGLGKLWEMKLARLPGNAPEYGPDQIKPVEGSPLAGKRIAFLGSSVTFGAAAKGVSFTDYLAARHGCEIVKEAVSGTTLVDGEPGSYVARIKNLDPSADFDLLVCQLSTNDATRGKPLGTLRVSKNLPDFDTRTIAGAMEYVTAYAQQTWHCPVAFYTNPRFDCPEYAAMVELLKKLAAKWGVGIINLWDDGSFNAISGEDHALYMADDIHPTQAGYREWWLPFMEKRLCGLLSATEPVAVTGGLIRGYKAGGLSVYKGIPYAADASGQNRWRPPQPVVPWEGVRDCFDWGPSAIQEKQAPFSCWSAEYIIEDTGYSEDCLSLNVWTNGPGAKPVLVYIHGGALTTGGSSCEVYDGSYTASQDVVYVSVNYRVGLLGFMAHPELSAEQDGHSGNYGFLDQIQALKWVRDNIAQFGGDPGNVTVMGQSAGAMSVNVLLQSPLAAGLFHKAVTLSGSLLRMPYDPLAFRETQYAQLFPGKSLAELRDMPASQLIAVNNEGPICVDNYVLTCQYPEALAAGTVNDVPVMTGMTQGDLFVPSEPSPQLLDLFGGDQTALNAASMIAGQQDFAQARAAKCESLTYVYHFTHVQPGPDSSEFGAFHTSDVPYFLHVFSPRRKDFWTEADYKMGDIMSGYLLNFARTGNPNGPGLAQWDPSDGSGAYLELDVTSGMKALPQDQLDALRQAEASEE